MFGMNDSRAEKRTIEKAWRVRRYAEDPLYETRKRMRLLGILDKDGTPLTAEKHFSLRNNGRCTICGTINKLCVDHCHFTKKFRGVLCKRCNIIIGQVEENIQLLQNTIDYLEEHR
jgi:hypothetical protein